MPVIRTKKLDWDAVVPNNFGEENAGFDLSSVEERHISPGKTVLIGTGLAIEIPKGYAGFIQPRSGLAIKHGVTVLNSPGLIDPGYRGEIKVILHNTGDKTFAVKKGDRIAQIVFLETVQVSFKMVDVLSLTERGKDGFGSTGVRV